MTKIHRVRIKMIPLMLTGLLVIIWPWTAVMAVGPDDVLSLAESGASGNVGIAFITRTLDPTCGAGQYRVTLAGLFIKYGNNTNQGFPTTDNYKATSTTTACTTIRDGTRVFTRSLSFQRCMNQDCSVTDSGTILHLDANSDEYARETDIGDFPGTYKIRTAVGAVPEPGMLAIFITGLIIFFGTALLGGYRRYSKRYR